MIQRLLESLLETTSHLDQLEVILYIDNDDFLSAQLECPSLSLIKVRGPRQTMGEMTAACYAVSRGRRVALINDDIIVRTPGWDVRITEAFSRFPDPYGMVYVNDRYYGPRVSTFPILTRECWEMLTPAIPAGYRRHCIDSHILDLFSRLARLGYPRAAYLPDVVFEHMHYGVSLSLYGEIDGEVEAEDRRFYGSLAEHRERQAARLAEEIRHAQTTERRTASLPTHQANTLLVVVGEAEDAYLPALEALAKDPAGLALIQEIWWMSRDPAPRVAQRASRALKKRIQCFRELDTENGLVSLNLRLDQIQGSWMAFLPAASRPKIGWLEAQLTTAEAKGAAAVGSKCQDPRHGTIEHAGLAFYRAGRQLRMSWLYRGLPVSHPAANQSRPLQAVGLSGMLLNTDALREAGGFSSLDRPLAPLDLCRRLRQAGRVVLFNPHAVIDWVEPWKPEGQTDGPALDRIEGYQEDLSQILTQDGMALPPMLQDWNPLQLPKAAYSQG